MFTIIGWFIYGAFIGLVAAFIARLIHPVPERFGCLTISLVGIFGSIIGSVINVILFAGNYNHFGLLTNILGGVIAVLLYHKLHKPEEPKS